eukprot:scaffold241120_cov33-Tisochrysis_lutea.AAC.1
MKGYLAHAEAPYVRLFVVIGLLVEAKGSSFCLCPDITCAIVHRTGGQVRRDLTWMWVIWRAEICDWRPVVTMHHAGAWVRARAD